MSRQTASRQTASAVAKRIALALHYRDLFERALRGGDDHTLQIIRKNIDPIHPGIVANIEAMKLLIDYHWPDIFSTEFELAGGKSADAELKARVARSSIKALAQQKTVAGAGCRSRRCVAGSSRPIQSRVPRIRQVE